MLHSPGGIATAGFFYWSRCHVSRLAVYIDGFNLYRGRLRSRPRWKWLDLEALSRGFCGPDDRLVKVRYFTSWVSGKVDPSAPQRQQTFLRALRSTPLVEVAFGRFEHRAKLRPLVDPSADLPRMVWVHEFQEKGSDVNLATALLMDGLDGLWDRAVVVSSDSDLESPIREAASRFGPVAVVSPHRLSTGPDGTFSTTLARVSTSYRSLRDDEVEAALFPREVRLASGRIVLRPASWS